MAPTPTTYVSKKFNHPDFVAKYLRFYDQVIYQLRFMVTERDTGYVIGAKSNKLKKIFEETGGYVEYQKDRQLLNKTTGDRMNYFIIRGITEQGVRAAWNMLDRDAKKAAEINSKPQHEYKIQMRICDTNCTAIMGNAGCIIDSIKRRFNLKKLAVQDFGTGMTMLIIVSDTEDSIKNVIKYILERYSRIFRECEWTQRMKMLRDDESGAHFKLIDDELLTLAAFREKHALENMSLYSHTTRTWTSDSNQVVETTSMGWGDLDEETDTPEFKENNIFDFSRFVPPKSKPVGARITYPRLLPDISNLYLAPVPASAKKNLPITA